MTATWSTPSDFAVAHIVTAAEWNAMEGASSNLVYLQNALGTIKTVTTSHSLNTVYQNTTGKIQLITIGATMFSSTSDDIVVKTDTSSPPSTSGITVAEMINYNVGTSRLQISVTFCVPPAYYYKAIVSAGSPTLGTWQEWTLATGS